MNFAVAFRRFLSLLLTASLSLKAKA